LQSNNLWLLKQRTPLFVLRERNSVYTVNHQYLNPKSKIQNPKSNGKLAWPGPANQRLYSCHSCTLRPCSYRYFFSTSVFLQSSNLTMVLKRTQAELLVDLDEIDGARKALPDISPPTEKGYNVVWMHWKR